MVIIEVVNSLIKSSVIFIFGLMFGIVIGVSGLIAFAQAEAFGVSLLLPVIFAFLFTIFFIVLFFKKDKIEEMK